ncbi:hypothetical protein F0P96_03255 [Hymenobacter busanensis]|uniref:Uncharacterized protein n=1 Tax=Hymenobacter busanensis TaxID=2607656 RepID=A0A7L4ZYS1_9BACT|nr:hypothetical protein [Hymenobacter busanensis]KAA9339645.1 hypothetical protein F0P96_03255 [Hymenobacter busanensis]QHJ06600.1 hypothetical protein GUY19_04495 [Hymenobacter busanensis]
MKAYLRMRATVLGRQLAELGWLRLALLVPMLLAAVGNVLVRLANQPDAHWALPLLVFGLVWSAHRRRADLAFLPVAAPHFRRWLMGEYALLSLPAAAVLLAFGHWDSAMLAVVLAPLAALANAATSRAARQRGRSVFRSEAFEWVCGFRQTAGWGVWAGLLGVSTWQHQQRMVPALAVLVWTLLMGMLYATPEPAHMLLLGGRSAAQVLRRRLLLAHGYYLLTVAPLLGLMAGGQAGWAGALLFLAWGLVVLTMLVLAKYAFYPQATFSRLTQGGVVALALLTGTQSVYGALLLACFVGLVWKSRQQLATFRFD